MSESGRERARYKRKQGAPLELDLYRRLIPLLIYCCAPNEIFALDEQIVFLFLPHSDCQRAGKRTLLDWASSLTRLG